MNNTKKNNIIGFVGLSHLGLISLAAAAQKGFKVIGYQNDKKLVDKINANKIDINEPNLINILRKNNHLINFSNNKNDLKKCNIVYISQDIPTNTNGKSNIKVIKKLINEIIPILNTKSILVVLCQVPPGFTRQIKWPLSQLYYQVETLIFGKAVDRAINPERIILGTFKTNKKISGKLDNYLNSYKCPKLIMKYESAELAKISINMFLASTITTTNILAEICENVDAKWSEIMPALTFDKRIGKYSYINAGLGISGGNLERDIRTVKDILNRYKINTSTIDSWIHNSKKNKNWVLRVVNRFLIEKKFEKLKLGILGLSYKENTSSVKNSPSINLINKLKNKKLNISVYDPLVKKINLKNKNISFAKNIIKVLAKSDILLIMTACKEFRKLNFNKINKNMKGKIIIDPLKVLNINNLKSSGYIYFTLGEKNNVKALKQ